MELKSDHGRKAATCFFKENYANTSYFIFLACFEDHLNLKYRLYTVGRVKVKKIHRCFVVNNAIRPLTKIAFHVMLMMSL